MNLSGMLGLVHMVQQRTLRSHHVDSHYCAKNFRNMRQYGMMLKRLMVDVGSTSRVTFVSSDDKAKVFFTIYWYSFYRRHAFANVFLIIM